jgi:small-conductance mechanosensitive channel
MNAASPDRSQAGEPDLANNRNSLNSGRWLLAAIMAALLLWGVYLARGAFLHRHNLWQGALVLICVLVYLCFWGGMLVSRRGRMASANAVLQSMRDGLFGLAAWIRAYSHRIVADLKIGVERRLDVRVTDTQSVGIAAVDNWPQQSSP